MRGKEKRTLCAERLGGFNACDFLLVYLASEGWEGLVRTGKALLCCGSGGPVGDWVKQSFGFKLNDYSQ